MQRLTLAVALLVLATGCAAQQPKTVNPADPSDACDAKGVSPSDIKYGNAYIIIKPVHNVKKKKQWRIKLKPEAGYETAIVIIKGKTADANWINKTAQASVDDEIYICVPEDIALGDYFYSVTVLGVGEIDPRIKVEN